MLRCRLLIILNQTQILTLMVDSLLTCETGRLVLLEFWCLHFFLLFLFNHYEQTICNNDNLLLLNYLN